MTTEERQLLTCQNCKEINDPGMLFCIHCGKGLTASAEKMRSNTGTMGGKCPSCGKQDELNMRFCIFCSAPMSVDAAPPSSISKFSWEIELANDLQPNQLTQPKRDTKAALKFKDAVQKTQTKKTFNYMPIGLAAGAILGLVALVPTIQETVKRTYLSGTWPAKSLTVYTKHPFAQVTVYEPSDAKAFTMAETDANGTVRFTNLEPGDYNMKITGKGLRTGFQSITIDEHKGTLVGYGEDKLVELQRDPNAAGGDADNAEPTGAAKSERKSNKNEPDQASAPSETK